MKIFSTAAILAVALASIPANAAQYNLNYLTTTGHMITAKLTGSIRSDNNTIDITSVDGFASYDGTPVAAALTTIWNASQFFSGTHPILPPILTLDGTNLDFLAADLTNRSPIYFAFTPVGAPGPTVGMVTSTAFGSLFGPLNVAGYSLTAVGGGGGGTGAVPEPASWAMLIMGFGLIGASARRRRQVAVTA